MNQAASSQRRSILIVDDEEQLLKLIQMNFLGTPWRVLTAGNGAEALALLEKQPVSLVLSDNKMPQMSGVELLTEVRRRWPDCARVILTGFADIKTTMEAINTGEVHKFLTKPWNQAQLLKTVEEIFERQDLLEENQRLTAQVQEQNEKLRRLNAELEKRVTERTMELTRRNVELQTLNARIKSSLLGSVRMFSSLLEHYDPQLGSYSHWVARLSREFAVQLGLDENQIEEIEMAGYLHDLGLMCLPHEIAHLSVQEAQQMTGEQLELYYCHPQYGQQIVSENQQFATIGKIIRAHHERYDGLGYPDGLQGEEIPLGARVLAITSTYCQLTKLNSTSQFPLSHEADNEVISALSQQSRTLLDPILTQAFIELLAAYQHQTPPLEVQLAELEEGMVLVEGIYTKSGMMLLGSGSVLRPYHLTRLTNFARFDPVKPTVLVRLPAASKATSTTPEL